MKSICIFIISLFFISFSSNAGCMKAQIEQINTKLDSGEVSEEKIAEATRLRDLVIENEHSDRKAADEFYTAAIELLK